MSFYVKLKTDKAMKKFEVTMCELGPDGKERTLKQTAICETRQQVIFFYGLDEPDIISYEIKEVE